MNIKKIIKYLFTIFILTIFLASCDSNENTTHTHTYVDEYTNENGHYKKCNTCGDEIVVEHSFSTWVTTVEATYTTTGNRERECSICGYKEEQILPIISHAETYGDYTIVEDENDSTKVYLVRNCIYCNKEEKTEYVLAQESYMLYNLTKVDEFNITLENIDFTYESISYNVTTANISVSFSYEDCLLLSGTYADGNITKEFTIDNEYIYIDDEKYLLTKFSISDGNNNYSLADLYSLINNNYSYYSNEAKLDIILNQENIISTFNNLFSLNESTYTLNYDYLDDIDEYLASTTVKGIVDSYFGDGTYNTIKAGILLLKTTKISTILTYLDQYEIDIDEIINLLDSVCYLTLKEDKYVSNLITSYLKISLDGMTFKEYFSQESISNLTVNSYLLSLGYSQTNIDDFITSILSTMSTIQNYNIYKAICHLTKYSNYDDFISKKDNYLDNIKNNLSVSINLSNSNISSIVLSYSDDSTSSIKIYPSN